jgi:hypothetical protein
MPSGQNAALKAEAALQAKPPSPEAGKDWSSLNGVNRIIDADAGAAEFLMPDGVTPRRKFALVGFASSTKEMAPCGDPEWVICGMNQLARHLPGGDGPAGRRDLWFEIHREWNTAVVPGTDHAAWLRDCGVPVLMTDRVNGLPTTVRFPIDRLIRQFDIDYFTSTVAYMLAYTMDYIDQQVEARLKATPPNGLATAWDVVQLASTLYAEYTIGVFGIDLIVGEEYDWQKACAEYWCGQIMARNITLMIPGQSALLKQRYRYGYQMEPDDLIKDSDLAKRMAALTQEHQKHSEAVVQLVGALRELETMRELRRLRERGGTVNL